MSYTPRKHVRVLAIDPCSKGFGFAVLESTSRLVDWGVARIWGTSDNEFLARVDAIVDRYQPALIALEERRQVGRATKAMRRAALVLGRASERHLMIARVSRESVRVLFRSSGVAKREIAIAIAKSFPELEARVPKERKPWESEDDRMHVFDAVAIALAVMDRVHFDTGRAA
jgi:Holliday junction resolvasome RuvABC endonuclease subunit